MAGAFLALAMVFAVAINVPTDNPIVGAAMFPVGFSMLYLMGFDLLTGVFVLTPLAWLDGRPGRTRAPGRWPGGTRRQRAPPRGR